MLSSCSRRNNAKRSREQTSDNLADVFAVVGERKGKDILDKVDWFVFQKESIETFEVKPLAVQVQHCHSSLIVINHLALSHTALLKSIKSKNDQVFDLIR